MLQRLRETVACWPALCRLAIGAIVVGGGCFFPLLGFAIAIWLFPRRNHAVAVCVSILASHGVLYTLFFPRLMTLK